MVITVTSGITFALLVLGIGVALESFRPVERKLARTVVFNFLYAAAFTAWAIVLQPVANAESAFLHRRLGIAPIPLPTSGPSVLLSAAVLMLASDLIFYWVHRAQHRYAWLWAMHSFHHSDDDVNVTTGYRHYWVEKPLFLLLFYLPLGLVFRISPGAAALYSLLFLFFSLFPHMNARIELGRWSSVLLGPQLHRLHHSTNPEDFNLNFAGAFPVWDKLFGTYRSPRPGEFPPTGVAGADAVPGAIQTFFWPLIPARQSPERAAHRR